MSDCIKFTLFIGSIKAHAMVASYDNYELDHSRSKITESF